MLDVYLQAQDKTRKVLYITASVLAITYNRSNPDDILKKTENLKN